MRNFTNADLYKWCSIKAEDLLKSNPKVPFRMVKDSSEMGQLMAKELVEMIENAKQQNKLLRAIIPCGPMCWVKPFTDLINAKNLKLDNFVVYHMDECLTWLGKELPANHPYSFRGVMQKHFYDPIKKELQVPVEYRHWLNPKTMDEMSEELISNPADIVYGGWGQDGHLAYNQARRNIYSEITLDDLKNATARIQENNYDTVIALAQRTFGAAYEFVPPMSATLGMKEILAAKKIRVYSDTGAWKQTALRVALFAEPCVDYPMTLLQTHPDALITATYETAQHPVSLNPDWDLGV